MIGAVLATVLATVSAESAEASREPCPPPQTALPRYPVDLLRANISGLVLVGARFDDCGRIVETRIDESSGWALFDESALAAVDTFVLSAEQRAKARDGWVRVPMKFGRGRPRYLPDDQPLPFASIDEFEAADVMVVKAIPRQAREYSHNAAGQVMVTTLRPDRKDPSVFWLTYTVQASGPASPADPDGHSTTTAVARYRVVDEGGVPVVRLAMLCERPADECDALRESLFKGLPFAKPRRL